MADLPKPDKRTIPDSFTVEENFAAFRPQGDYTFEQMVEMVDNVLAYCRENDVRRLLVNIREVTGFPPPTTMQRFLFATKWSATAGPYVRMSMVCHREFIDSEKIGVTMALNRGLRCEVFTEEPEALTWLLSSETS
jgi:hypothetical protein